MPPASAVDGREDGPPLPAWAHRPGRTQGPDRAPLDAAKRLVPRAFEATVPPDHPAVVYGLRLHDAGYFWEAHEVWEAVWRAAPQNGIDRLALRALIQIANAGLKRALGHPRAVDRLLREAERLLAEVVSRRPASGLAGPSQGLDVGALRVALEALLKKAPAAGEHPLIHLASTFGCRAKPWE